MQQPRKHRRNCGCMSCLMGPAKMAEWEKDCMERVGWYAHTVSDADNFFHFNAHTHGFPETFKHPDLEIVYPLTSEQVIDTFRNLVHLIRAGKTFTPGDRCGDEILHGGFHVEFVASRECDRPVLRVIIPDKKNITNRFAAHPFCHQWDDIP